MGLSQHRYEATAVTPPPLVQLRNLPRLTRLGIPSPTPPQTPLSVTAQITVPWLPGTGAPILSPSRGSCLPPLFPSVFNSPDPLPPQPLLSFLPALRAHPSSSLSLTIHTSGSWISRLLPTPLASSYGAGFQNKRNSYVLLPVRLQDGPFFRTKVVCFEARDIQENQGAGRH